MLPSVQNTQTYFLLLQQLLLNTCGNSRGGFNEGGDHERDEARPGQERSDASSNSGGKVKLAVRDYEWTLSMVPGLNIMNCIDNIIGVVCSLLAQHIYFATYVWCCIESD